MKYIAKCHQSKEVKDVSKNTWKQYRKIVRSLKRGAV